MSTRYNPPCSQQVEIVATITLIARSGRKIEFRKTGFGQTEAEAKADAERKLQGDKYYQFLLKNGAQVN